MMEELLLVGVSIVILLCGMLIVAKVKNEFQGIGVFLIFIGFASTVWSLLQFLISL